MDGRIVAIGGCDAWNCLNSMEIYDPESDVWAMGPPMTANRRGCGIAVFRGMPTTPEEVMEEPL